MRNFTLFVALASCIGSRALAQENLELYRGNKAYGKGDFEEANDHYQKALQTNGSSYKGSYNSGNARFRQQDVEGAISSYQQAVTSSQNSKEKAQALHNLGNAYLQAGKLDESIKAYKDALRLQPDAEDTRYNLAFAQRMKKKQEQQEQQQQDQNQDQQKRDQENKDQQNSQEDKKEQDQKDQQNEEQQQEKKDEKQEQQSQPKEAQISEREAEQMLDAAKNDEQKLLMQLSKQRQKAKTKTIDKDW